MAAPTAPRQYSQTNRVFVSGIINEIYIDKKKPKDVIQPDGTTKYVEEEHIYGYIHCSSNDTQSIPKQLCFLIPTKDMAAMLSPYVGKHVENLILDHEYQAASYFEPKKLIINEKNSYVFYAFIEELLKNRTVPAPAAANGAQGKNAA